MKLKNCLLGTAVAVTTSFLTLNAHAANVLWQSPVAIGTVGVSEIVTTGTFEAAYQYGTATGALTVNGVTFADVANTSTAAAGTGPSSISFKSNTNSTQQGNVSTTPSGVTGSYESLVIQNSYQASGKTWTLNNLTSGNDYLVQFWAYDSRFAPAQTQIITGGANATSAMGLSVGYSVVGNFTATGTTQDFTFSSQTLNAMQVRSIPEPSSIALLGLGGLALIVRRRRA